MFLHFNFLQVLLVIASVWWNGVQSIWAFATSILLLISFSIHSYLVYRDAFVCCYQIQSIAKFLLLCIKSFINGDIKSPWIILFRLLTYKLRVFPNVIVLGEQKCATTTLAYYLREIFGMKGPFHYWNDFDSDNVNSQSNIVSNKESEYFRGIYDSYMLPQYYSMCFGFKELFYIQYILNLFSFKSVKQNINKQQLWFDACPNYLFLPFVRDRINYIYSNLESNKKIKFIIMVRDPIDRAVSNYKAELTYQMDLQSDYIDLGGMKRIFNVNSLNNMIDYCQTNIFNQNYNLLKKIKYNEKIPNFYPLIERFGIIQKGMYHDTIEWYFQLDLFKNNTLIIYFNELTQTPKETMIKIAKFLEIQDYDTSLNWDKIETKAHRNKNSVFTKKSQILTEEAEKRLKGLYKHNYKDRLLAMQS